MLRRTRDGRPLNRNHRRHGTLRLEPLEPRVLLSAWSGHIDTDTLWDNTSEPYEITGTLYVDAGVVLTIGAGVDVTASGTKSFYVEGTLDVNGTGADPVAFTGSGLRLTVQNAGVAHVVHASTDGSVKFTEGGSGSLDAVDVAGKLTIEDTPDVTVEGGGLGVVDLSLASPTIRNNTIEYIDCSGGLPTIEGNTFSDGLPLRLADPDTLTTLISGNTFEAADPQVRLTGRLNGTRQLGPVDGLTTYQLYGSTYIESGAELHVDSGIDIVAPGAQNIYVVDGWLVDDDASYTGASLDIEVREDGVLMLSNGTVEGDIEFADGGGTLEGLEIGGDVVVDGTVVGVNIQECTLPTVEVRAGAPDLWQCTLEYVVINGGSSSVRESTLSDPLPVRLYAPGTPTDGITGNTFSADEPRVELKGHVDTSRTLEPVDGLSTFELKASMYVDAGAALDIGFGIAMAAPSAQDIYVDGELNVHGVTFTGDGLDIHVRNGGSARLLNSLLHGELEFEPGSSGDVNNVGGTWSLAIDGTDDVAVVNSVLSSAEFEGGASPTLRNSQLGYVALEGGAPVLSGNTFADRLPLRLDDPDTATYSITANMYDAWAPCIQLGGSWDGIGSLGSIDGLARIELDGTTTVEPGAELTIESGLEVVAKGSQRIRVEGTLTAYGVTFTGEDMEIDVRDGGEANLGNSAYQGTVEYQSGSAGAVGDLDGPWELTIDGTDDVTVQNCQLEFIDLDNGASPEIKYNTLRYVELDLGAPVVQSNTFTDPLPLYIQDPDVDTASITGNTFTAADPRVRLSGHLEGTRVLANVDSLTAYEIYIALYVEPAAVLTLGSAVEVVFPTSQSFNVEGTLIADEVAFRGSQGDLAIRSGSAVNLTNSSFETDVDLQSGSSGNVENCWFANTLKIHADSTATVTHNDFELGDVRAAGSAPATIDMADNWWDTTNAGDVEEKVYHVVDSSYLPTVVYEPFLTLPPRDYTGDTLAEARLVPDITLGWHDRHDNIGSVASGNADVDLFEFSIATSGLLLADIDAAEDGSPLDSVLRVFDDAGAELAISNDATDPDTGEASTDSYLELPLDPGTYYVGVSGYANSSYDPTSAGSGVDGSTGVYDLHVLVLAGEPETEANDTRETANYIIDWPAVRGEMTDGDGDWFRFVAERGDRLHVTWTEAVPFVNKVAVVDASGTVLDQIDENDDWRYTFSDRGTYFLHVCEDDADLTGSSRYAMQVEITAAAADPYERLNLVYVVDRSGSTSEDTGSTDFGDPNQDGVLDTVLDGELASLFAVNKLLAIYDDISVGMIAFEGSAATVDMSPNVGGDQLWLCPANASDDGDDVPDLQQAVQVLRSIDGTDFDDALSALNDMFETAGAGVNVAVFLSDSLCGVSTAPGSALLAAADAGTQVHTMQVGGDDSLSLETIADLTGGIFTKNALADAEVVADALLGMIGREASGDALFKSRVIDLSGGAVSVVEEIGDGELGGKDVDLFRFAITQGSTATVSLSGELDGYLRIFDASGNQILAGAGGPLERYLAAGTYYVGVSGDPNRAYFPSVPDTGVEGATGPYTLDISLQAVEAPEGQPLDGPPFDIVGDFQDNGAGGLIHSGIATINGVIYFDGTMTYDADLNLLGNGVFWMEGVPAFGSVVLYDGDFFFPAQEAVLAGVNYLLSDLPVAGLEVSLEKLTLLENGVRIQGALGLPKGVGGFKLDFSGENFIDVTSEGVDFAIAIEPPDLELDLKGIAFKGTDPKLVVYNEDSTTNAKLTGTFKVSGISKYLPEVTVELKEAEGNYFLFGEDGWDIIGAIEIGKIVFVKRPGVPPKDIFYLDSLRIELDTVNDAYKGQATVGIPLGTKVVEIEGVLGILQGFLDTAGLTAKNLEITIYTSPPILLDKIGGRLDHMAPNYIDEEPTMITVLAGLQLGPSLGDYKLLYLDLDASLQIDVGIQGQAALKMGNPEEPLAEGSIRFVWIYDEILGVKGALDILGILTAEGGMMLDEDNNFKGSVTCTVEVPEDAFLIGAIAGGRTFEVNGYIQVIDNDDLTDDYAIAGVELKDVPVFGSLRAAVEVNLNTRAVDWLAPWDRIKTVEIPALGGEGGQFPLAKADASSDVFPVDPGVEGVIFYAGWETGDGDLHLVDPSGNPVTPANVEDYENIHYYKNLAVPEAFYLVGSPEAGDWTLEIPDTTGMGDVVLRQLEGTTAPQIDLLTPDADGPGGSIEVTWTDSDSDSDAQISLYYDTDRRGGDGHTIVTGISEDDPANTYTWDTSGLPTGDYYVYAVIDDGMNVPALSYALGRISVVEPGGPPAATGLTGYWVDADGVYLSWEPTGEAFTTYAVLATPVAAGEGYEIQSSAGNDTELLLDGLEMDQTYRIAVQAIGADGVRGPASEPIVVEVGDDPGPASPDDWDVSARAGTGYGAFVPGAAGDTFTLVSGPAGAQVVDGQFTWSVPGDASGWHEVLIHVTSADGTEVHRRQLLVDEAAPAFADPAPTPAGLSTTSIQVAAPLAVDATAPIQYRLERDGEVVLDWQNAPALVDAGLAPNSAHSYRVQARDGNGLRSDWTAAATGTTLLAPPPAPTLVEATPTALTLALDFPASPAGTELALMNAVSGDYIATDGSAAAEPSWAPVADWDSVVIGGLAPARRFRFAARARNADGDQTDPGPSAEVWTAREQDPPTVVSVAGTTRSVVADFSEFVYMDLDDLTLAGPGGEVDLASADLARLSATEWELTPAVSLDLGAEYTVTLSGQAVQDTAANLLDGDGDGSGGDDHVATFTTDPAPNLPPTIASLAPTPEPVGRDQALTLTANGVDDTDGTVASVDFYRDANGDQTLTIGTDEQLGTDDNGADGWAWSGPATWDVGTQHYFAVAHDDQGAPSDPVAAAGTVEFVATPGVLIGHHDVAGGQVWVYDTDAAGLPAADVELGDVSVTGNKKGIKTVKLDVQHSGLGIVVVQAPGSAQAVSVKDVTRGDHAVSYIAGNCSFSSVKLTGGLLGHVLSGVALAGGVIQLPDDVDGDGVTDDGTGLWTPGDVKKLDVAGNIDGDLVLGGNSASLRGRAALTADVVADGYVKKLHVAGDWACRLEALWVGNANTRGTLGADITTTGADPKKGISIATLQASRAADATISVPGGIRTIKTGEWLGGAITAGWVVNLAVAGDFSADVDALSVKSMTVKGNLESATIDLTQAVDPKLKALSKLIVKGWTRDTAITTAGHVAKFQTGGMDGSCLLLGVTGMELPDEAADFNAQTLLKSFTVKGIKNGKVYGDSFIDSDVAAWCITKASLREVVTDNTGDPFGFAWCELKSLKWQDGRDKFKWPEKKPTDWPDDAGDFVVTELS